MAFYNCAVIKKIESHQWKKKKIKQINIKYIKGQMINDKNFKT